MASDTDSEAEMEYLDHSHAREQQYFETFNFEKQRFKTFQKTYFKENPNCREFDAYGAYFYPNRERG